MRDNKKITLANELEEEKNRLPEFSMFGDKNDLSKYDDAILYLKEDLKPKNYESNDLLTCCIEDIETMYLDYDIN